MALAVEPWSGPWEDDDPHVLFKAEVALHAHSDWRPTLEALSIEVGIPVGGLAHHALAAWCSAGAAGLLELGPTEAASLDRLCRDAEADGSDAARLAAYHALRGRLSWLVSALDP